jgi:protein-disulfide isomerase
VFASFFFALFALGAEAQVPGGAAPLTPAQLQRKVELQVRKLYALGTSFTVKVGDPLDTLIPGLVQVQVEVGSEGQTDVVPFFITRDGRYFMRGELFDTAKDPFADTRAQLNLAGAPSKGPANARVTVVEFADFQCPTCRVLYSILKDLQSQYPQVRFVYKDFPLDQIHPWAMTAAIAARCAYQQKPAAFWQIHDRIYDNQDIISPAAVWQTMIDYAVAAGLDASSFRTCMTSPGTKAAIQESFEQGQRLKIANTPTVFVNGRRLVGADRNTIEQYIRFELDSASPPAPPKP